MVPGHVFWCQVKVLGPWILVQTSPAMGTAFLTEVQPQDSLQQVLQLGCSAWPHVPALLLQLLQLHK